jgi:LysR family glycine cleavage system transcriptional activator
MRDINLKSTEYFEAVARLGTVTKASKELGVSPSAVSQQINLLEKQLNAKLFKREKKRLILTLDGDRLYQTTKVTFGALRNVKNSISKKQNVRNFVIRVSPSFGVRWLGPRIAEFANDNKEWNIRIDATPDFSAFEVEGIDLDIRYGMGGWSGLNNMPIMKDFITPICSPTYFKRLQKISKSPDAQIQQANLIDSIKTLYRWDIWLAKNKIDIPELSYQYCFDRSSMSIELAKEGGGLALDSVNLCLNELISKKLIPLSTNYPVVEFSAYWLVCPERNFSRRIVNRFYDWLLKKCNEHENNSRKFLKNMGCSFVKMDEINLNKKDSD